MKLLPMKVTALLPGFLKGGKTLSTPRGVSDTEVLGVQTKWAAAIAHISDVHAKGGDFVGAAADAAGELYAYGHGDVLFKPTKAAEYQFRPTAGEAMSYRRRITKCDDVAIAMGNYRFTCKAAGSVSKVEYTFGYKRCEDDEVRIFLHHSSVPYAA
ncbi:hypothetical protein JL722_14286 [Aureococcus anophagefferens]|nr:hypothetical protein JL722_14286 [Aureococcus anophagefferens]